MAYRRKNTLQPAEHGSLSIIPARYSRHDGKEILIESEFPCGTRRRRLGI